MNKVQILNKSKINHWSKNPEMKKIVINKISKAGIGRKMPESHKNKRREYMLDKWKNNRIEMIKIIRKGSKKLIGRHHTKEARQKIKEARAKQVMKPLSEEHKRRFCYANKGRKRPDLAEYNKKVDRTKEKNHFYGKKHTKQTKEKISISNKGNKHTKETKNRLKKFWNTKKGKKIQRERRAKQIFPLKDTTIEVKIQDFLKELRITFFTHQYMKEIEHSYQCDIFIPKLNLVIECDGNYWHKYPVGNEVDHIRTSELISKGFKVLRLWEHEIKVMDINNFKNILDLVRE